MIKILRKTEHGHVDHGWLNTYHHFSFASYYDPNKMGYGPLRVLNDDYIAPHTGFEMHPHKNMEIITYVIDGILTHKDSLDNERKVSRGQVQYMSAGSGIFHSEHNRDSEVLRLLQIWVVPKTMGGTPNYGDFLFSEEERSNKWLQLVGAHAKIEINQDVNFYVTETNKDINFEVLKGRKVYVVNIEGETMINGNLLSPGDALQADESLAIEPTKTSHVLVIEMRGD